MSSTQVASFGFGITLSHELIRDLPRHWAEQAVALKVIEHVVTPDQYREEPRFDSKTGKPTKPARIKVKNGEEYYTWKGQRYEDLRVLMLHVLRPEAANTEDALGEDDLYTDDFVQGLFPKAVVIETDLDKEAFSLTLPELHKELSDGSIYSTWFEALPLPNAEQLAAFEAIRTQLKELLTAARLPEVNYYPKGFAPLVSWAACSID